MMIDDQTALLKRIQWLEDSIANMRIFEKSRPIGGRVIRTTAQNIAAGGGFVPLVFDQEIHDTGALNGSAAAQVWTVGNATRLVAPITGYYMAGMGWSIATADVTAVFDHACALRQDGATALATVRMPTTIGKPAVQVINTGFFRMVAGQYIECLVSHGKGVAVNTIGASAGGQDALFGWLALIGAE